MITRTRRARTAAVLLFACSCSVHGAVGGFACEEGFDDVATLSTRGWTLQNNSEPLGPSGWMQGDPNLFLAYDGASDSYIAAGADSASGAHPVVSNWLITPDIDFGPNGFNVRLFGFYTRAVPGQANRLVARLCMEQEAVSDCRAPGSGAGDLGGFQTRMLDINPDLLPTDYPDHWTAYSLTSVDGLPVVGRGRIAFHYYVFSQPDGSHGTTIGIDAVSMAGATVCPFTDVVFATGFD